LGGVNLPGRSSVHNLLFSRQMGRGVVAVSAKPHEFQKFAAATGHHWAGSRNRTLQRRSPRLSISPCLLNNHPHKNQRERMGGL
jgi:hypothetical protein